MNAPDAITPRRDDWADGPISQVPGWVYTDPDVYRQELDRFFYRGHWCYVGLACEVPEPGDFKPERLQQHRKIGYRARAAIMARNNRSGMSWQTIPASRKTPPPARMPATACQNVVCLRASCPWSLYCKNVTALAGAWLLTSVFVRSDRTHYPIADERVMPQPDLQRAGRPVSPKMAIIAVRYLPSHHIIHLFGGRA